MNPFQSNEISWNDPIRHICSFLAGKDLLNLSKVDSMFNKIITGSKAAMKKIRFVLDFNDLQLDDVIELGEKRQFTAIRFVGINETLAKHVNFTKLLNTLGSVEDIIIEKCTFKENQFHEIIQAVLPKLKKCELKEVELTSKDESKNVGSLDHCSTSHPLEHLKINKSVSGVLQFFDGCNQLITFVRILHFSTNYEAVYDFVTQQAHLKKLDFFCYDFDWSRMTCFHLVELITNHADWDVFAEEFSTYLKKLRSLKMLHIFTGRLSRRLMEAICRAPKLESLTIYVRHFPGAPTQAAADVMVTPGELFNNTVKFLDIRDDAGVSGCLLKIFRAAAWIFLTLDYPTLDLSDVPYDRIEKIELKIHKEAKFETIHVVFSPAVVPENVERFESVVLGFAEKFSAKVHGITIGNNTWRNNSDFRLSNSFYERLVDALPLLQALELHNVADIPRLESFLTANRPDLIVRMFHELLDEEDFINKLMNIELN